MIGISMGHLVVLAVVVLLFGSRKIPELAAAAGKGIRSFKDGLNGIDEKESQAENKSLQINKKV